MTWDELKADVSALREGNETYFPDTKILDSDLQAMKLTSAKNLMKIDLNAALNLNTRATNYDEIIDNLVNYNQDVLKLALSYKQLEIIFFENSGGNMENGNNYRFEIYAAKYEKIRKTFHNLNYYTTKHISVSKTKLYK